jgi:hypothetical protein
MFLKIYFMRRRVRKTYGFPIVGEPGFPTILFQMCSLSVTYLV